MPTNTDNSGTARAARLRRIVASQGPTPAVRPNIGSMALDAQLGKMECCPCGFNWTGSPIQLAYQETDGTDLFTAVFANAAGQFVPLFGQAVPSPCGTRIAEIETDYSNNRGALSVIYKISNEGDSYIPATITQQIALIVTCEGATTRYERTITFLIPEDNRSACP